MKRGSIQKGNKNESPFEKKIARPIIHISSIDIDEGKTCPHVMLEEALVVDILWKAIYKYL